MRGPMYPTNMTQVIGGKRYSVNAATHLADNVYWDGSNYDRGGRNTFLFRTKNGRFFRVDMTMWQGEHDSLTPIGEGEAKELYEELREHHVEYEEAFPGSQAEEA